MVKKSEQVARLLLCLLSRLKGRGSLTTIDFERAFSDDDTFFERYSLSLDNDVIG